jgi:hypothetical protein
MKTPLPFLTTLLVFSAMPAVGQHPPMPPGMTHEAHLAQLQKDMEMKRRGAEAMGFDQDAVLHHFLLKPSGGSIVVLARYAGDLKNVAAIRAHLRHIAIDFSRGNFQAPFATHGETPPDVSTLQRLKSAMSYSYAETTTGGRVDISTTNAEAIGAVHDFLRYQIREHHTGDSETLKR